MLIDFISSAISHLVVSVLGWVLLFLSTIITVPVSALVTVDMLSNIVRWSSAINSVVPVSELFGWAVICVTYSIACTIFEYSLIGLRGVLGWILFTIAFKK